MPANNDRLLTYARGNSSGIKTAESFHNTLIEAAGGYTQLLKYCSANSVKAPLRRNARNSLVFETEDSRLLAWHGGIVNKSFGNPRRQELSPLSIMDVEYTITTKRRDRDKDVLEPRGASIDKGMPFLLHHCPELPVGALIEILHQDDKKVDLASCIADTPLGRDSATLVEVGAFRTSHGFQPKEYEPLTDEQGKAYDDGGWHIKTYDMMESSLVTIPSNADAVITAFSRSKLHHPTMKLWAGHMMKSRLVMVKGGWTPPAKETKGGMPSMDVVGKISAYEDGELDHEQTVELFQHLVDTGMINHLQGSYGRMAQQLLNDGEITKSTKTTFKTMSKVGSEKLAEQIAGEEGKFYGMSVLDGSWYAGTKEQLEKIGVVEPKAAEKSSRVPAKKDADGKEEKEERKADEEAIAADDKAEKSDETSDKDGASVLLVDIRALLKKLSKEKTLPDEALDRLVVVDGMLKAVESSLAEQSKAIAKAAKSQDLAAMLEEVSSLVQEVAKKLAGMLVELGNILRIEGMPSEAATGVQEVGERIQTLLFALGEASGQGQPQQPPKELPPQEEPPQEAVAEPEEKRGMDGEEDEQEKRIGELFVKLAAAIELGDTIDPGVKAELQKTIGDLKKKSHYISTINDLRNWVDDHTSHWIDRGDHDVDNIANAIRNGECPAWGTDWTDFLAELPDLTTFLDEA